MSLVLSCAFLLPLPAHAHKLKTAERAVLQVRPDATEVLYELAIPSGKDAAQWRVRYDVDHNGRISPREYEAMAKGIADAVRDHLKLKLEGNVIPLEVKDSKVTSTEGNDQWSGRLAALVWLTTREVPPGKRTLEVSSVPLVDPKSPVVMRIEVTHGQLERVTGAVRGKSDEGMTIVKLRDGVQCRLLLNIPKRATPSP